MGKQVMVKCMVVVLLVFRWQRTVAAADNSWQQYYSMSAAHVMVDLREENSRAIYLRWADYPPQPQQQMVHHLKVMGGEPSAGWIIRLLKALTQNFT
jgi:hypothetical protein